MKTWNEERFLKELEKSDPEALAVALRILGMYSELGMAVIWADGYKVGKCYPLQGLPPDTRQIICLRTDGMVEILFRILKRYTQFEDKEYRIKLLEKLNDIKGVNLPETCISSRGRIPLSAMFDLKEHDKFINAIWWATGELYKDQFGSEIPDNENMN